MDRGWKNTCRNEEIAKGKKIRDVVKETKGKGCFHVAVAKNEVGNLKNQIRI